MLALVLLAAQLFGLMPHLPLPAAAAETAAAKTPMPFAYCHAAPQSEQITMGGVKYSDAILFTMGYNGQSNGSIAEVTYNFKGQYSSMSFSAGYASGWERDATLTVIADGVTVKDEVAIKYTDIAKSYTVSLAGVKSLTIRFKSDGYDKTRYAIANVKISAGSNKKEDKVLVSDEFYDITRYRLEGCELIKGAFSMGGYDYENGYLMQMGYSWNYDYTATVGFNFENRYKKLTFDIARHTGGADITYTRSAYLTIEVDGKVLSGYDKKELKWNDVSMPVTVDLNGASQVVINVNSDGYDRVTWAIGNVQLVSDGHAHGILFDMEKATVTTDKPTVDLNPRVYPSDAKNKKYTIVSDGEVYASVDEEGIVTGHYNGKAVITATTEDGGHTVSCNVTSKLPAFELINQYKVKYVLDTEDFTDDSREYITIVGSGDGSLAGDLARAYVEAGRVITDGYGGAINGLSKVMDLNIEIKNDFDFLISDLFSGMFSTELYESLLNDEILDAMSDVLTYLGKSTDILSQIAVSEAITDFGELPDVTNSEIQKHWATFKKTFTSEVTYESAGKMFSALGGVVDLTDAIASGCDDVGKMMEYYVLCNGYASANKAYAKVLQDSAKKMSGANPIMSPALTEAVSKMVSMMDGTDKSDLNAFYLTCGKELGQLVLRTKQIVSDTVAAFAGTVSVWSAIRDGVKIGTSLANSLTATDDRYCYGKMLHMAGFLAEGMHKVVLERQAAFDDNPTYKNAEAFSAAVEVYLNLQILACDYAIWYYNSYAACGLGQFKLFSDDEVAMANILLIYKVQLMELRDSKQRIYFGKDGSISGFAVSCPVTVVVENKNGEEIARMETGKITTASGYDWAFQIMGKDHEQKAGFYDPKLHNVRIIAQESGTMHVVEYSGTDKAMTSGSTYVSVPIEQGDSFVLKPMVLAKEAEKRIEADERYPATDFTNPFTDVLEGAYYYDPVMWAVQQGVTTGMSETIFAPDNTCTRAQIVTFLWRASGSPEPASANMPFTDVAAGSYYEKAVLWAVEEGITKGTSDTTFGPDQPCTRGQVVTFLWRSLDEKMPTSDANPFLDVPGDQYYYNAVLWAVENKITNGMSANAFSPDAPCSRGQIVTFLYRALVLQ